MVLAEAKKYKLLIIFFFFNYALSAQFPMQSVLSYTGTWRWVSGNQDTFLLILKPENINRIVDPKNFKQRLVGFHKYVEKGQLIESNLEAVSDSVHNLASEYAFYENNFLHIAFGNLSRDRSFKCSLQFLNDFSNKAVWHIEKEYEQEKWNLPGKKSYPPGCSIPNNLVLEKIK